jgi:diguanylate cyclase (GGDEF)-like protein
MRTIFILGTDPEQCAELKAVLQANVPENIVTVSENDPVPRLTESDTVILTAEERDAGVMYRNLLQRLEAQVNRTQVLGDLVRLSITSASLEEMLENVVSKSTTVLGDTSFIVLTSEGRMQLEAIYSADPVRLKRMLMTAVNVSPQAVASQLLEGALEKGEAIVLQNLQQTQVAPELHVFIEKYGFFSLIATPIRSKDSILGAFVSLSTAPRQLGEQDVAPAIELADFTAMVIENARLVSELQRSATTDPLTGVFNTRFFHEVLQREIARAQRYNTKLSLLMIDVDSFKIINDTYGHVVGDKVLVHIGRVLVASVRTTDLVFRCGGDEFGVVLLGTSDENAEKVARKILESVQAGDGLRSQGHDGETTVTIGIAEYHSGEQPETLVSEADQALIDAKKSGKNRVRVFRRKSRP